MSALLGELLGSANGPWRSVLAPFAEGDARGLHLAVFVEPYLGFVLDGSKTVESRFSLRGVAPRGRVVPGDLILLKGAGKPVTGVCVAGDVWDYDLDDGCWPELRTRFGPALRAQDGFWESRAGARYATMIEVRAPRALPPLRVSKRDRRGWVVLADSTGKPRPT